MEILASVAVSRDFLLGPGTKPSAIGFHTHALAKDDET